MAEENVGRELKPAGQLSDKEIVTEAVSLHARYDDLAERYRTAQPSQRAEIRQEIEPIVHREHELRAEAGTRAAAEISRDRVPEPIGYSR